MAGGGLALFFIAILLIGGLVIVPALLRGFVPARAESRGTGAPPSFGPLAFQSLRDGPAPLPTSGSRPAKASPKESEPDDMVDALIDVRRVEKRVNAATMKRFAEIVERHPEAVGAALRRWLNDVDGHR